MLAAKTIKKEVGVLFIEPKLIEEYWPLAEFMVKEGLKYDGDPMSVAEMKKRIKRGEYQLHIMVGSDDGDKYKVFGIFVTRIAILPNFNQVEVILLKGEKRELWQKEAAETIEHLAIQHDCKKIAVLARPGWKNFLEPWGWKVKRLMYQKELK
jgi:hypothetical protein